MYAELRIGRKSE